MADKSVPVYKVCSIAAWEAAAATGSLAMGGVDERDGFVHMSTAEELQKTLDLYYGGATAIVILVCDIAKMEAAGGEVKFEWAESRQADFPHLFNIPLPVSAVTRTVPIATSADGKHSYDLSA